MVSFCKSPLLKKTFVFEYRIFVTYKIEEVCSNIYAYTHLVGRSAQN